MAKVTDDIKNAAGSKALDKVSRRQELLAAALKILGRNGYNATAIAQVAKETGLTLPGLLHHFPSKADLLVAILQQRDEDMRQLAKDHSGGWRQRLNFFRVVVARNTASPEAIRLFSFLNAESLGADHPAAPWLQGRSDVITHFITEAINAGISEGEIREEVNPSRVATQIIAMMDGLQILWLRNPDKVNMVDCLDSFIETMIRSIEKSPEETAAVR